MNWDFPRKVGRSTHTTMSARKTSRKFYRTTSKSFAGGVSLETELHTLQAKYEHYVALTTCSATARRYSQALEHFFSKFKDKKAPDEFSRADIEDYKLYRKKDGVSPRTINYEVGVARAFWNWMLRQEIIAYNPVTAVKRLKEIEPERNRLSEADQVILYQTAAATGNVMDLLLVGIALSTGLRAETIVQLEKSHVDFETNTLRIPAAMMKTRRNHDVPLREEEASIIRTLPEGVIFSHRKYARKAIALAYRFNRLLKRAGIKWKGLRLGRRTFATTMLRNGADLKMVQDLLGHRNIITTSRYLITADQKETRAAIDRLPKPGQTPPEEHG